MSDEFAEPSGAANFLQRYHEVRKSQSQPQPDASTTSTPTTPTTLSSKETTPPPPSSPPRSPRSRAMPIRPSSPRSEATKNVWGSVFHPLGKSPTSADRYDLGPGQQSIPGHSASEVHAKGSGISLDDRQID